MELEQQIQAVERRIDNACDRSGRQRESVKVIAVTKYVSLERAQQAVRLGCKQLGENRWPDAAEKYEAIGSEAAWHFIGHLQSRKVKHVIDKFQYIHSLDRLSLADELDKRAADVDIHIPCFIQVNVSGEESKYGVNPTELVSLISKLKDYSYIQVVGLMTMAPFEEDAQNTRSVFRRLRELRDELNELQVYPRAIKELSMGMSNDFEIAIEEGATYIRLGSVLVGNDG